MQPRAASEPADAPRSPSSRRDCDVGRRFPIGSGAAEATCKSLVARPHEASRCTVKHYSGNEIPQLLAAIRGAPGPPESLHIISRGKALGLQCAAETPRNAQGNRI